MAFKINTDKGWTEAIIDDDCDFNKFYKVANILEVKLNIVFSAKFDSPDTSYWDFSFDSTNLSLAFNIYEEITVFPVAFKDASQQDNDITLKLSGLLFIELAEYDWYPRKDGKTIGNTGSESGTITEDFENINGARITLEKDCANIQYSVTLGIYGLMFHTHYEDSLEGAQVFLTDSKFKINQIFELYDVSEARRNEYWHTKHNKLINGLAE